MVVTRRSGLAETPPGPRMHDLLYWSILRFEHGTIRQVEFEEEITFEIKV